MSVEHSLAWLFYNYIPIMFSVKKKMVNTHNIYIDKTNVALIIIFNVSCCEKKKMKLLLWGSKTKAHDQGPGTPFH